MALTVIEKSPKLADLDDWGQITNVGGEVLDGTTSVDVYGKMSLGAHRLMP